MPVNDILIAVSEDEDENSVQSTDLPLVAAVPKDALVAVEPLEEQPADAEDLSLIPTDRPIDEDAARYKELGTVPVSEQFERLGEATDRAGNIVDEGFELAGEQLEEAGRYDESVLGAAAEGVGILGSSFLFPFKFLLISFDFMARLT